MTMPTSNRPVDNEQLRKLFKDGKIPPWADAMAKEAFREAQKRIRQTEQLRRFSKYINDPIGFAKEILGDQFTDEIRWVIESVRDNPVTIARSGNAVGKTFGAARAAVWFYEVFPDSQVYLVAAPPIENLKRVLWGEIQSTVQKHPDLFKDDKIKSFSIARSPRSFITGVAIPTSGTEKEREAKFSGKHAPHLLFVVDEGDAVPDEVYRGIESCLSGGAGRMLIMFNPRSATGTIYMKETEHKANVVHVSAFHHPNVVTGSDVIPGAITRDITVRRINEWTRPQMPQEKDDYDTFEIPEFLVGAVSTSQDGIQYPPLEKGKRKIIEPAFSYMVLGMYPAQSEQQLISLAWIEAAVERRKEYVARYGEMPPVGVKPVMSLDIAEYGGDWNVAFFRYGGFVSQPVCWQGMDIDEVATKGLKLYLDHGADILMADGMGVGAGVAPSIARRGREQDVRAISVKVSEHPNPSIKSDLGEFRYLRDQIWWAMREWFKSDANAMIPNDRALIEELKVPTYTTERGKVEIMDTETIRKIMHRSPDRASSLALSFAPFNRAKVVRLSNG